MCSEKKIKPISFDKCFPNANATRYNRQISMFISRLFAFLSFEFLKIIFEFVSHVIGNYDA